MSSPVDVKKVMTLLVTLRELITQAGLGEVVSFPTDTVPALAVLPKLARAIFNLKKRSHDKPLILMSANIEQFWSYITGSPEEEEIWHQMAKTYWPGALTLVLPASGLLPKEMNSTDSKTIGLRIPNHPVALEILLETGPLATTSANLSGELPLENMSEIATTFPSVYTLNYQSSCSTSLPSTVAKWTGDNWQILRQGSVIINH